MILVLREEPHSSGGLLGDLQAAYPRAAQIELGPVLKTDEIGPGRHLRNGCHLLSDVDRVLAGAGERHDLVPNDRFFALPLETQDLLARMLMSRRGPSGMGPDRVVEEIDGRLEDLTRLLARYLY